MVGIVSSSTQDNTAAQQTANDMINDLDPQMLLIVGIAGGVPSNDFTLGDVIVSTHIDNFNVRKREEDGTEQFDMRSGISPATNDIAATLLLHEEQLAGWNDPSSIILSRPTVDLSQFDTDTFKKKIAANADKDIGSWYKKIQSSIISHFGSTRSPLFETGRIASSNSVIRDIDLLIQWLQNASSILAVEMEAAGVYQATQRIRQRYPLMAIRGISDIIELDRDPQWTEYACQTAAAFTYAFVTAGIVTPRGTSAVTDKSASISTPTAQKSVQPSQTQSSKQADDTEPINVFVCYAKNDEKFKKQLETHLVLLKRQHVIHTWNSQQINVGQEWKQEIADYIDSAQIILLLMSPSFIASDQLYDNEMIRAINRQGSGDPVRVIPIAVRPIALDDPDKTPYQKIQGLPRNGKPIESWRSADEAWAGIAQEIQEVCKDLLGSAKR